MNKRLDKGVLFEFHRAVVPIYWAEEQLKVCIPWSTLISGIPMLAVFQNLRWSNKNKYIRYMASDSI